MYEGIHPDQNCMTIETPNFEECLFSIYFGLCQGREHDARHWIAIGMATEQVSDGRTMAFLCE